MAWVLQVQLDMILARLSAQYTPILMLKEVNVAHANTIAMIHGHVVGNVQNWGIIIPRTGGGGGRKKNLIHVYPTKC
jgi:hypothetical protein